MRLVAKNSTLTITPTLYNMNMLREVMIPFMLAVVAMGCALYEVTVSFTVAVAWGCDGSSISTG